MTDFWSRAKRYVTQLLIGLLSLAHILILTPQGYAKAAPSTSLVINEIQLAGPASTHKEFVDLYNKSADAVDISNWSLKKYTETGNGPDMLITFPEQTIVNGHDYILVAHPDFGTLSPDPDFTYGSASVSLADNNSVVLQNKDKSIVDLVRLGTAKLPDGIATEGEAAANPPSGSSISRNADHADTDNNVSDFTVGTPSPMASKPNKPVLHPIEPENRALTVSWDKVRNARKYEVSYKAAGADAFTLNGETLSTEKKVFPLTNGITYTVQVIAKNENGMSLPATQTGIPGITVTASVVYYQNGQAGTHFGPGLVTIEVATSRLSDLSADDKPTLVLKRPKTDPATVVLQYNQSKNRWVGEYTIVKSSDGRQDGTVISELKSEIAGKNTIIKTGGSFTVDTFVAKPNATVTSRCPGQQDSFTATTDSDVTYVYVYKAAAADSANLIVIAPVTNGKTDEIFIGDNAFSTLYLVAKDKTGNLSEAASIHNPISSPQPQLKLETKDGVIIATWPSVAGASSYTVQWRQVGENKWQEKVTSNTREEIPVINGKAYEVQVSSRDTACNVSSFSNQQATAHKATDTTHLGRGGMAMAQSERESAIFSQAIEVAGDKDGIGVSSSTEQTGKGEGSSKVTQGKTQPSPQVTVSTSPSPSSGPTVGPSFGPGVTQGLRNLFNDRSRLVITLAILLIVIGSALALYSGLRGGNGSGTSSSGSKNDNGKGEAAQAPKPSPETNGQSKPKKSGKGRKTRW